MPDNKCTGGCGNAVTSLSTCKTSLKFLHPGCTAKHKCQPVSDDLSLIQMFKLLQQSVNDMAKELRAMREKYDEMSTVFNDLKTLREENSILKVEVNEVRNKILLLEARSTTNAADPVDSVTNISNELYERKIRENNIIIYGVPESASNNRFEVYAEDLQITRDKLNNIKPDLAITKIIRPGKKFDNKPRPIKVIPK